MIMLENQVNQRSQCDIILVLQHEQAFWMRLQEGKVTERYSEPIENNVGISGSACPWLDVGLEGKEPIVQLVLDSMLDEVDRVAVSQTASATVNRWRRLKTMRRLKNDYPQSRVYKLSEEFAPHVASVVHCVMSPLWDQWLAAIQEQGVMITTVASSIDIFSYWSSSSKTQVLLVQSTGVDQRQLLLDDGSPVFLRHVDTPVCPLGSSVGETVPDELAQTFQYLSENVIPKDKHVAVGNLVPIESTGSAQWDHVEILVRLLFGDGVAFVPFIKNQNETLKSIDVPTGADAGISKVIKHFLAKLTDGWAFIPRRMHQVEHRHWRVESRIWIDLTSLHRSADHWRSCKRLDRLRYASLVCAAAGMLTVIVASVHGVTGARMRNADATESVKYNQLFEAQVQRLSEQYSEPFQLAKSIQALGEYQDLRTITADQLLPLIAKAITNVKNISLERLVWRAVDDLNVTDVQQVLDAAPDYRHIYWTEGNQTSVLLVGLEGIVQGGSLGLQKETLEKFASTLLNENEISALSVLESPVDAALSNEQTGINGSRFRINLIASAS